MLYTPHSIIGASIAYVFPNPFVALPLSFVSHFLFDVAPHSNPSPRKSNKIMKLIMLFEIIIGTALLLLFSKAIAKDIYQFYLMVASGLIANLPDFLMIPYVILKKNCKLCKEITLFQKLIQTHVPGKWGYTIQIAFILLLFWSFLDKLIPYFGQIL